MQQNGTPKGKMGRNRLINSVIESPTLVWDKRVPDAELRVFQKIIEKKYNKHFDSYWEFHKWSVENFVDFWEEIWSYFGVITSEPYDEVFRKTGDGFLDNEWFRGAKFNFAENMLRFRDDKVALICNDELGNEEVIRYSELFEEVKLYAAAFRKHGLTIGDRVACYMSNRKECVYAMLAAASIGAIWGGAVPFCGARATTNIIKMMEPKFLISIDHHQDSGKEYHNIDNLQAVVECVPSLEKVVIVATKEETLSRGIAHIRNSCFLEEFLQSGRNPDGTIPDIVFEQLPFDHPITIGFTSGTTGLPKGPVHSAGTFIALLRDFALHLNLKEGDVIFTCYPMGWSVWYLFIPCLARGMTLFLYSGCPYYEGNNINFWALMEYNNVSFALLVTSMVDKMEKEQMLPSPDANLSFLDVIAITGSPVKKQNFQYIRDHVKKDVFVTSMYGATEVFGEFSGCDLNIPAYAGEIQVPALGVDIRCFDENGHSIVGRRGELVVATPTLSFPVCLWKDVDSKKLNETYLSKYPGAWCQNDECWINPKTNGIIIIGRSDDTLKQYGERFGSGDIYFAIHNMEELDDYVCVGQDRDDGDCRAVLFVKMKGGYSFSPQMKQKIAETVHKELWEDCVPQVIVSVPDVPYNLNNKRMESVVRRIVQTKEIPEVMNIKNPECLKHYCNIPEIVSYNK